MVTCAFVAVGSGASFLTAAAMDFSWDSAGKICLTPWLFKARSHAAQTRCSQALEAQLLQQQKGPLRTPLEQK